MKLSDAMTIALDRAGLNSSTTGYKNQVRLYLNIVAKRISGQAQWWWLNKTGTFRTTRSLTVSGITGTFQEGEEINDAQGTPYSATIDSIDTTNSRLYVYSENSVTPTSEGTLTGQTSGAYCTFASREFTQVYYLAADVLAPINFYNQTNGEVLTFQGYNRFDKLDPERDETGDVSDITVDGIDVTAGHPGQIAIRFHPAHSTTNETIRYRYLAYIPDWTESNDSTELDRWIPEQLQSALVFGAAELYMQEKGDDEGANINRALYEEMLEAGKEQNLRIWGTRKWRRRPATEWVGGGSAFDFSISEGSLTA
jgi:hypothetical protein